MRITRHNGRAGVNGVYNPKHNDRNFDLSASEHIDEIMAKRNVYYTWLDGLYTPELMDANEEKSRFAECEWIAYGKRYTDHIIAQNERNEKTRHTENALRKRIAIMTNEINDGRLKEGLDPIKPRYLSVHDLRHTYATLFLNSAVDGRNYVKAYKMLAKQLGHKSHVISVDLYSHLFESTETELIDDFNLFMNDIFNSK